MEGKQGGSGATVEPRDAGFLEKWGDDVMVTEIQTAQRVDEKGGTAAEFFPQERDSGTRMVKGFHHHVFQFVSKKLLDGSFVLRFYFGIVGEQPDGSKITSRFVAIGSEQLLHSFGAVRTVAQDLSKRVAASFMSRPVGSREAA